MGRNWSPSALLVENSIAVIGNRMKISQNVKIRISIWPSKLFGTYKKQLNTGSQENIYYPC
jgi:hypothetical protein